MVNPFEKRATEYLRDDEAFLAVITPEPLATFFQKPAEEGRLYDRLVMIIGTPGSGKTTLSNLFQYSALRTLIRNSGTSTYKPLIDMLTVCGAIEDARPTLVAYRIPLEGEYREFWAFPYQEDLKHGLLAALLQARSMLGWLRNLQAAGIPLDQVAVVPRADADAALNAIGGTSGPSLLSRAREVEHAIYKVSAALVPPNVEEIETDAVAAYRPFDVIESFRVSDGEQESLLRPLLVLDDAHTLHPQQWVALRRWLARRELKVARWVLTRLDALAPKDVLLEPEGDDEPGLKAAREITEIWMQSGDDRGNQRRAFRKMAKDMSSRYLSQMTVFNRRGLGSLADLMSTEHETLPASKRDKLHQQAATLQRRHGVSAERRRNLEAEVARYLTGDDEDTPEMRLAMLCILFERYAKRTPTQQGLFEQLNEDPEPNRPLTADHVVFEGARIHLFHRHERPYYYGIDTLCDSSSENAEQFLQLAARLVSQAETQLIRAKPAMLGSALQHRLLRERAAEMVRAWNFPQYQAVQQLAEGIAAECLAKTMEGNASLGGGANAYGIPQDEFDLIPREYPELARVLQFGVAYNAFSLVPHHGTKKKIWCLIELGGVMLLKTGLTLKRGGFVERKTQDLLSILAGAANET